MKVMPKDNNQKVKFWREERDILAMSDCPFITKLFYAFQNTRNLFLVMELCPCGDMKKILDKELKFSEPLARKYICEILIALEYLHKNDVIYRDLKPDNILVDKDGHIKLADFGFSATKVGESYMSTDFVGTPAYLAPDVLQNIPYGKPVDWYCLGVILYEFLHSQPPFLAND